MMSMSDSPSCDPLQAIQAECHCRQAYFNAIAMSIIANNCMYRLTWPQPADVLYNLV